MKLFLSSYRLGKNADDLVRLVSSSKRIGVVRNALDFSKDQHRLVEGRDREFSELLGLDLSPVDIDLRQHFDGRDELRRIIDKVDALWVTGGNAFILRRAMRQSGLDRLLQEKRKDQQFVYAGYSAGACVATPSLKGIHWVDDPEIVPEGYSADILWDGLGLVPFCIAPHYRSNHPDSEAIETSVTFFIENKIPFITLRDGETYVGDTSERRWEFGARCLA